MKFRNRRSLAWLGGLCLLTTLTALTQRATAVPTLRYQTDLHGDIALIGNTLGFDCRAGLPDPKVGSVNRNMCTGANTNPIFIDDSSADVFWRCEDNGQVSASPGISLGQARSAAVLQLPTGATVAYARIYWSSTAIEDMTNISSVVIDRPGGFMQTVTAATADIQAADKSFQASADITELLQAHGSGVYRVAGSSGFPKSQMTDKADDQQYAAWAIVVLYKRDADPVRNLAVYDGLTFVSPTANSSMMLRGFVVPPQGSGESKLAIVGYEGDHDQGDDSLVWKGNMVLSDGQTSPGANFFNSSRTVNGQPFSMTGDLPELLGNQGSMSGVDLDIVNITSTLVANETQAQLDMLTGTQVSSDRYFVGAVISAITSRKPVLEANLTVPGGITPLPGDTVEYTLTVKNVGDDIAGDVYSEHVLPPGLDYVPGTVVLVNGAMDIKKTDMPGDDEVDYDSLSRTVRIRIGTGASATLGGTMMPGGALITLKYQLRVADGAFGTVGTQVIVRATPSGQPTLGPTAYPSGDGTLPNHPTVITVRECGNNYDCTLTAPVCDTRVSPHRCTASCATDTDCQGAPGGQDVCGTAKTCAQCTASNRAACVADGLGAACLSTGACGCNSDADCGGRRCDVATNTCPKPVSDLTPKIASDVDPADLNSPVNLGISILNQGTAGAPSGAQLYIQLQSGGMISTVEATMGWRCILETAAVRCTYFRPIAAGSSSPEVKLRVMLLGPTSEQAAAPSLTVQATATSTTSTDPKMDDNTVSRTIEVGRLRVAGGGFGCSFLPDGRTASLWSVAAVVLAALVTRRRRWTNRANA